MRRWISTGSAFPLCQSLIDSGLVRSPAELYSLEPQAVAARWIIWAKNRPKSSSQPLKRVRMRAWRACCARSASGRWGRRRPRCWRYAGTLDKLMAATAEDDSWPFPTSDRRRRHACVVENPQSQHQIRLRARPVSASSPDRRPPLCGQDVRAHRRSSTSTAMRPVPSSNASAAKQAHPVSNVYLLAGENTGSKYPEGAHTRHAHHYGSKFLDMIQE